MSFKHTNSFDSPIMRSLERIAYEKGLIKPESMQKTAAPVVKKADFTPGSDLMDNIFKLCAGMRAQGFHKEAMEVEMNYINYKRAQTLYETSKEKGEDVIRFAHPKGSHKLENVEGEEATFEDILDQHAKILRVMNKKPTGKLSSATQVLNAVKKALGEAAADGNTGLTQPVINGIMSIFKKIDEALASDWNIITGTNSDGVLAYNRLKSNFIKFMNGKTINNTTLASINSVIDEAIRGFSTRELSKAFYISDAAEQIIFQLKSLKNYMNDTVVDDHKALLSVVPASGDSVQKFTSQMDSYLTTLRNWSAAVNNDPENSPDDKKQAMSWINDRVGELNDLKSKFQPEEVEGFLIALNKSRFVREQDQFKKVWIG